jgi:large subunit ribosomal protein L6
MRRKYSLSVDIPEGAICEFNSSTGVLSCKKGDVELKKKISLQNTDVKVDGTKIKFTCEKANKKSIAMIKSHAGHVNNMFKGIEEKFVYEMEVVHVHFPITAKVEGSKVAISNYLGEKINRTAKILDGVNVEINGQKINVSGNDIERTGQTAANIEKASRVRGRDKRVFQDGIYITTKPGGAV